MLEELQQLFYNVTGLTEPILTEKTGLKAMPGVTSLTLITLVCAVEDHFGVEIPNTELRKMKTVGELLRYLENEGKGAET